jgi:hypothetical protein
MVCVVFFHVFFFMKVVLILRKINKYRNENFCDGFFHPCRKLFVLINLLKHFLFEI